MNIKNIFVIFTLSVVSFLSVQAQDCSRNLTIFSEYAKAKNYQEAYIPWRDVYDNCPNLHSAIYIYGEYILKDKIDNTIGDEKAKYIKDLENLYDKYNQYYPTRMTKGEVNIKKAILMYNERTGSSEEIFALLDNTLKNHKDDFTNPMALYVYFFEAVRLYDAGKKTLQEVSDIYNNVNNKIKLEKDEISKTINALVEKEDKGTLSPKEARILKISRSKFDNYEKVSESIDIKARKIGQL